jgi:hypothetical protein
MGSERVHWGKLTSKPTDVVGTVVEALAGSSMRLEKQTSKAVAVTAMRFVRCTNT